MNNKFDEPPRTLAQSGTRGSRVKKYGSGMAAMALACLLLANSAPAQSGVANVATGTSTITDAADDAVWPFALYDGPVPPYLDIIRATVSFKNGAFHFEIQMAGEIPKVPSPGLTPSVNHHGATAAIQTDRATSGTPFKFIGQTDEYHFNFLVGALYSFADSGLGLPLGWSGFFIDTATFTAVTIPMKIRGDTFIFDVSAHSLGDPSSFLWIVATECDPVPITVEKTRSALIEDYAPDHGYTAWPPGS